MVSRHEHAQLIDALGAPPVVAGMVYDETGVKLTRQAVHMWRRRGVSYKFRSVLARLARTRGVADRIPAGFILE